MQNASYSVNVCQALVQIWKVLPSKYHWTPIVLHWVLYQHARVKVTKRVTSTTYYTQGR